MSTHIRITQRKDGIDTEVRHVPEGFHEIPGSVRDDVIAHLHGKRTKLAKSHRKWLDALTEQGRDAVLSALERAV